MRKITLCLCVLFLLCLVCGCGDRKAQNATSTTPEPDSPGRVTDTSVFYKKPTHVSHYRSIVLNTLFARSFLLNEGVLEGTGFEESEINNNDFGVGVPYTLFSFDCQGQLIEDECLMVCPLKNNDTYIGKAVVRFDEALGKNVAEIHKEDLSAMLLSGTVDTEKVLTIGKLGSKTFVTDGVNLDIIAVDSEPHSDDLGDDELKALAATFKAAAGETYQYVCGYYITVQPIEQ